MLKTRLIPCLDVKDGRVVKGVRFLDLRDAGDPVAAAKAYDAAGADELCFLDITASHEDRGILLDVVRRTAEACFMPLTVGGGVRAWRTSAPAARRGRQGPINTAAVRDPGFVRGPRRNSAASASWWRSTPSASRPRASRSATRSSPMAAATPTGLDAVAFARGRRARRGRALVTSMDRDGTRAGYDLASRGHR